jgi:hypothetical protein
MSPPTKPPPRRPWNPLAPYWPLLVVLNGCFIYNCNAPSKADVRRFFAKYDALEPKYREPELKHFFNSLLDPETVEDDAAIGLAADMTTDLYLRTHHEEILAALDSIDAHAGAAEYLCGPYKALKDDLKFRERYRRDAAARGRLERCVGLSIGESDFDEITGKDAGK